MSENRDPFKLGISIGMAKGQRQYFTGIDDCPKAIHDANRYIHDKFDDSFTIYFVNNRNPARRRSRRRS